MAWVIFATWQKFRGRRGWRLDLTIPDQSVWPTFHAARNWLSDWAFREIIACPAAVFQGRSGGCGAPGGGGISGGGMNFMTRKGEDGVGPR